MTREALDSREGFDTMEEMAYEYMNNLETDMDAPIAIALEDRHSDMELARMFNVDCAPHLDAREGSRMRYDETPYTFNDIRVPLWKTTKRQLTRGEKAALTTIDRIRPEVSRHPAGSQGRIEDLAAHYANVDWDTEDHESAFELEN